MSDFVLARACWSVKRDAANKFIRIQQTECKKLLECSMRLVVGEEGCRRYQ